MLHNVSKACLTKTTKPTMKSEGLKNLWSLRYTFYTDDKSHVLQENSDYLKALQMPVECHRDGHPNEEPSYCPPNKMENIKSCLDLNLVKNKLILIGFQISINTWYSAGHDNEDWTELWPDRISGTAPDRPASQLSPGHPPSWI